MAIGKHYDLDTDGTLANNSDSTIASQKAVKTYVDNEVSTKANDADVVHKTGNESISGTKTFTGSTNSVVFNGGKNQLKIVVPNNNTNGITFFNSSNKEVGYYQMNTTKNAMFMGYWSNSINSNPTKFGYLIENGSVKYQVLIPYSSSIGSSSTPIYYLPLAITDGTNSIMADSEGNIDISTLLPSGGNVDDVQINGASIVSAGIANITIDSALSNTSENPVQNKAVKTALDNKQDTITSTNKLSASLVDGLSIVATSGSYDDLTDKPTIPQGTVTSVRVQAGTGLSSSQSTAQSTTLNTTISIASGYKLPTTTEWGNKQDVISDLSTIRDGASAGATAVQPGDLATVATTGAYSDLSGTPSLSTVAISGSYNDLSNKPTIPTVNDAVLTIQKNGATVSTFTANSATNAVANITVPTKVSDLTNDSGYITGITAKNVTTALGYTPYDSTNPSGYISGITANNITVALGYTPYNSTNPNGYTSNTGTVKSVQVQAGTGLTSSTSTAQNTTLNTTISIASDYKLPTTTEWSGKQDALTTQTAYTSKGTATKVPQITTNTLGQVTNITEVTITQPTVNNSTITIQKNSTTVDSFTLNQSSGKTINISVPTKVSDLNNDSGFITGITANNVTTALGYTPYNSTNPNGYITSADIPTIKNLNTNNTTGQTASISESLTGTGTVNLHKVSKTGSYNDLLNKPTIPAAQIQSDWNQTNSLNVDYIKNKPSLATVATSGSYNDLSNKPTIPTVNNAKLTIQKNGTAVSSFTANASANVTCNITVPTKTSDITNDSGYITSAAIPTKLSDFTDDLGSSPVHTHSQYLTSHQTIKTLKTDNTTGQTTSSGEALTGSGTINLHKVAKTGSYNDLLNKPTIPTITDTYSATSSDGMSGKAVASAISNKADKSTSLSGYGITDAYTKTEIDGMVSAGMHFKGTVASYSNLPATGNKVGDMWNVTDTGANYAWDGTAWDKLSENVDLSGYVPTSRTINNKALTGNISLTASDVGALPDSTVIPQGTVKSVQVQAGTGLTSSTSTAQNTTLSTTISIASGYKLPTTTEWGNKQDALTTQTAYTSKGSATKVPQITTNNLGQVTGITEVTITHPTEIPSQSGNSGKFLTTNGSAVSWATVNALPSQSGQSGKFLTTNGTNASWSEPTTWTYTANTKTLEIS